MSYQSKVIKFSPVCVPVECESRSLTAATISGKLSSLTAPHTYRMFWKQCTSSYITTCPCEDDALVKMFRQTSYMWTVEDQFLSICHAQIPRAAYL